jgi:O-antigen ligase
VSRVHGPRRELFVQRQGVLLTYITATGQRNLPAKLALFLLGLAWTLPFFSPVFREPVASFYGEAVAFGLGLCAIACMLVPPLWDGIRLPRAGLMFLGFALVMVLQMALGKAVYPQLNLLGALYVLWAAGLALLAFRLRQVLGIERVVQALCWFLLAGSLLSAAIGAIQLLGVTTPLAPLIVPQLHGRIYANTGQPNHLASYLCLGLASAGYLLGTRRISPGLAALVLLTTLPVLASSGSRAVWFYATAFVVLAGLLRWRRPGAESTRIFLFSLAIPAGLLLFLVLLHPLLPLTNLPVETIASNVQNKGLSSAVRLRFWEGSWLMLTGSPLIGVGFKQFAWNYFTLAASVPGLTTEEGVIDHAHNVVVQVGAELGVAGLLVLLGGLAWWFWAQHRERPDPQRWWILAALWVLGLHSMLEYPLWYAYFLGIAAVLLGLGETSALPVGNARSGRVVFAAAVLLGVMAFSNVYRDYRTLQGIQRPPQDASAGSAVGTLLDLQGHSLFAPFIELALARKMLLNTERLQDKIVLNARVLRYLPTNDIAYRQPILLAMAGDMEGMRAYWDMAAANYPNDRIGAVGFLRRLAQTEPGVKELLRYAEQVNQEQSK